MSDKSNLSRSFSAANSIDLSPPNLSPEINRDFSWPAFPAHVSLAASEEFHDRAMDEMIAESLDGANDPNNKSSESEADQIQVGASECERVRLVLVGGL